MTTVPLRTIGREWLRMGVIGFGGPPAHIALLRKLCVNEREWLTAEEFEHAVATTGLLPGPASTQLAIYCAWRLRGVRGALLGGLCFIVPGLIMIIALSALFFAQRPAAWLQGAALGAGAVVPAIALTTGATMIPPSVRNVRTDKRRLTRWVLYATVGAVVAMVASAYVVIALIAAGVVEILARRGTANGTMAMAVTAAKAGGLGVLGSIAWLAFKVGALSYGGGFVIIPLMQHDVVSVYHWMSGPQFLNAVALGQITPGPVVLTTAAVGYAARGIAGALLATVVAFGPSFIFILAGGSSFERLRTNPTVQAFFAGAGPCVIGAIAGATVPLALLLSHLWQVPLLVAATGWLWWKRGSSMIPLLGAAVLGAALSHVLPL